MNHKPQGLSWKKKKKTTSDLTTAIALWWAFHAPVSSFIIHPSVHCESYLSNWESYLSQVECLAFVASTIKSKWFSMRSLDIWNPAFPPNYTFFPFFPPTHFQLPWSLSAAATQKFLLFNAAFPPWFTYWMEIWLKSNLFYEFFSTLYHKESLRQR